jgi:copper homeostasis protein
MLIEVPVGNIESVEAAHKGGADRIELCSALPLGGLTPSHGMFGVIKEIPLTKYIMIRPREGDFVYSASEFRAMLLDIERFKESGADGIVSGVLMPTGEIDSARTTELIEAARPLPFTFHRAFDQTNDAFRSLEILIGLNADRVLTSGLAKDAFTGRDVISRLIKQASNKIIVIPGSGINTDNVSEIIRVTGAKEIHLSGKKKKRSTPSLVKMGDLDDSFDVTDEAIIKRVREIIGS